MYKTIMVPLDGFVTAEDALPLAARMAVASRARVHVVHAVDLMTRPPYAEDAPSDEWWSGGASRYAEAYLNHIVEELVDTYDVRVTRALVDAPLAASLMGEAYRVHAGLLVMTTHGRSAAGRVWMGSVADEIIRRYEAPMLVLRSNEQSNPLADAKRFKKILVPLDGSRLAEQILPHARQLARVDGAALTLLHVGRPHWTPVSVLPFVYASDVAPMATAEIDFEGPAREYLDDVATTGKATDPCFTDVRITDAQPALAILDYAKANDFDAIAITTHGHGGLRRLLLGSVADKVVRGADVPVLVYRPHSDSAGP
jgi:nucleotide-binding universal stress UspA family protein